MSASLFINQRGTTKKTVASIINLYRHHLRSILEQGRELKYDINLAHLNAFYIDNKLATREQLDLWLEEFEPKTTRAQFVENCLISDNQLSKLKADTTARINDNIRKWMGTKNKPSDMPEEEKKVYEAFILRVKGPIPKTQIINDEIQDITKEEFSDIYLNDIRNYYNSGVRVNRIDSKLKTLEKIVDNQWKLRNADVMAKVANTTPNNAILYDSLVIKVPTTNDFDPTNEQLLAMRDAVSFLTKGYKKLFTAIHRDELVDDKGSHLHECYEAFNPQNCRFDMRTSMFKRTLEYAEANGIHVNPELLKIKNWSDDKLSCFKHGDEEDDQEVNNKKKKKKKKVDNPLMSEYGKLSQIVIFHAVNAAKIPGLPVFEIRPDNDETKLKIKEQEKKNKKPLPKIQDVFSQYGLAVEKAEKAKKLQAEAEAAAKLATAELEAAAEAVRIENEKAQSAILAAQSAKIEEDKAKLAAATAKTTKETEEAAAKLAKENKEKELAAAAAAKTTKETEQAAAEAAKAEQLEAEAALKTAKSNFNDVKQGIKTVAENKKQEIINDVYEVIEKDTKIENEITKIDSEFINIFSDFNKQITIKEQPLFVKNGLIPVPNKDYLSSEVKQLSEEEIKKFIKESKSPLFKDINKFKKAAKQYYGKALKNTAVEISNKAIEEALTLENNALKKENNTLNKTILDIPNLITTAKAEAKLEATAAAEKERNDHYKIILDNKDKDIKNYQNRIGAEIAENEKLKTENKSLKNRNAFIELVAKGFKYIVSELGIKSKVIELSYLYNKEVGDAVLEFLSDKTAPRNDGIGNKRGYK